VSGIAFLLIAVGLSLVGSLVIWLRSRKPTTWDSGIHEFSRNMEALAQARPEPASAPSRRSRRGRR